VSVLLVDGDNLAMRALHAVPEGTMEADGVNTGATVIFMNLLARAVRENGVDRMLVAFDSHDPDKPLVRREVFSDYKAQRKPAPPGREETFGLIQDLLDALEVEVQEVPRMEADDLIASAWAHHRRTDEVLILSGDKDLLQLTDGTTAVLRPGNGALESWDATRVWQHYGVPPERLAHYLALVGDVSDNIPGVRGIGPKKALKIVQAADEAGAHFDHTITAQGWDEQRQAQAWLSYVLVDLREETLLPPGYVSAWEFPLRPTMTGRLSRLLDKYRLARLRREVEQGTLWGAGENDALMDEALTHLS